MMVDNSKITSLTCVNREGFDVEGLSLGQQRTTIYFTQGKIIQRLYGQNIRQGEDPLFEFHYSLFEEEMTIMLKLLTTLDFANCQDGPKSENSWHLTINSGAQILLDVVGSETAKEAILPIQDYLNQHLITQFPIILCEAMAFDIHQAGQVLMQLDKIIADETTDVSEEIDEKTAEFIWEYLDSYQASRSFVVKNSVMIDIMRNFLVFMFNYQNDERKWDFALGNALSYDFLQDLMEFSGTYFQETKQALMEIIDYIRVSEDLPLEYTKEIMTGIEAGYLQYAEQFDDHSRRWPPFYSNVKETTISLYDFRNQKRKEKKKK